MSQTCNCIETINNLLRDQNKKGGCELLLGLSLERKSNRVYIVTQNDKGKLGAEMGATYCPFCGAKYDAEPDGARLITLERRSHRAKGWTPEHDDEHVNGELFKAALLYILPDTTALHHWPKGWKQPENLGSVFPDTEEGRTRRIEHLKIGASLIAAEIDRVKRLKIEPKEGE